MTIAERDAVDDGYADDGHAGGRQWRAARVHQAAHFVRDVPSAGDGCDGGIDGVWCHAERQQRNDGGRQHWHPVEFIVGAPEQRPRSEERMIRDAVAAAGRHKNDEDDTRIASRVTVASNLSLVRLHTVHTRNIIDLLHVNYTCPCTQNKPNYMYDKCKKNYTLCIYLLYIYTHKARAYNIEMANFIYVQTVI